MSRQDIQPFPQLLDTLSISTLYPTEEVVWSVFVSNFSGKDCNFSNYFQNTTMNLEQIITEKFRVLRPNRQQNVLAFIERVDRANATEEDNDAQP